MKLSLCALVALCLAVTSAAVGGDYDYEEAELALTAPTRPPTKTGKLGGLLTPRNRGAGNLTARKPPATTSAATNAKTVSSTQQPTEQAEEDYEEVDEVDANQDVSTTTTTEQPKKIGRGTVVRPFRSNEDLLAALKRRRAQGVSAHPKTTTSTEASTDTTPPKLKSSARTKSNNSTNEVPKSTSRQRFGGVRSKTTTTAVHEEAQETHSEDMKFKPYARKG